MIEFWNNYNSKMSINRIMGDRTIKILYEKICDLIFAFRHQKIIDNGSGIGAIPALLKRRNFSFENRVFKCIDYSNVAIEKIKKSGLSITSECINIKDHKNGEIYDISLLVNVVNGMDSIELFDIIKKTASHINNNYGIIILVVVNKRKDIVASNSQTFLDIIDAVDLKMYSKTNYNIWSIIILMKNRRNKINIIPIMSDDLDDGED